MELKPSEARRRLRMVTRESRDQAVIDALDSGLSKSEIFRLTGLARTTIDRIEADREQAGEHG